MENNYQNRMALIKKLVLVGFIASLVLGVVAMVLIGLYNAMGVFTIHTGTDGSKYENPFTYPGWQSLFGFGGAMIIQGYDENTADVLMILSVFLPIIGGIVCSIMLATNFKRKGTNKKKAIIEFVFCGLLIFAGLVMLLCDKVWIANASRVGPGSYANYYEDYLLPAIRGDDGGYFRLEAYPIITGIVCIIAALIKGCNGALLLYQKQYAKKNAPSKENVQVISKEGE